MGIEGHARARGCPQDRLSSPSGRHSRATSRRSSPWRRAWRTRALLLHGGRALRLLGLPTGARDTLTKALRRRKGRPAELLRDARYERALCYEALGQRSRARQELERVYAEDPDHEDTAQRLGLG